MKKIKIPEPVHIRDVNDNLLFEDENKTVPCLLTFKQVLEKTILLDNKFGVNLNSIIMAANIKNKLNQNSEVLELENEEWEKLWEVTQNPTGGYNTVYSIQLIDFFMAIMKATDA